MENKELEFQEFEKSLSDYSRDDLIRVIDRTLTRLGSFEEKYHALVWYARSPWMGTESAGRAKEIAAQYPDETEQLSSSTGDWEHGFNSGCLAAARLFAAYIDVLGYVDSVNQHSRMQALEEDPDNLEEFVPFEEADAIEEAEEEFPFLDT
jgi:hypothetical protein